MKRRCKDHCGMIYQGDKITRSGIIQFYKIVEIDNNGDIVLQGERYGGAT